MIDLCGGCAAPLSDDSPISVVVDDGAPVAFGLCDRCLENGARVMLRYPERYERVIRGGVVATAVGDFVILLRWRDEKHFESSRARGAPLGKAAAANRTAAARCRGSAAKRHRQPTSARAERQPSARE